MWRLSTVWRPEVVGRSPARWERQEASRYMQHLQSVTNESGRGGGASAPAAAFNKVQKSPQETLSKSQMSFWHCLQSSVLADLGSFRAPRTFLPLNLVLIFHCSCPVSPNPNWSSSPGTKCVCTKPLLSPLTEELPPQELPQQLLFQN